MAHSCSHSHPLALTPTPSHSQPLTHTHTHVHSHSCLLTLTYTDIHSGSFTVKFSVHAVCQQSPSRVLFFFVCWKGREWVIVCHGWRRSWLPWCSLARTDVVMSWPGLRQAVWPIFTVLLLEGRGRLSYAFRGPDQCYVRVLPCLLLRWWAPV